MTGLQYSRGQYTESQYGQEKRSASKDLSLRVGRLFFDTHVPPQPTVVIGESTAFTGTIERSGGEGGNFDERYDTARNYIERANEGVITGTMKDGSPWFTETHGKQTLLVRIMSGADHRYLRDYWGVIVGGTDESQQVFGQAVMTVETLILARERDYDSRQAAYEAFGR